MLPCAPKFAGHAARDGVSAKAARSLGPIEAEQTYCGLPSHCLRMEHLGKHFANARIKTKLQHQHPLALRVVNQCTLSQNKIPEV